MTGVVDVNIKENGTDDKTLGNKECVAKSDALKKSGTSQGNKEPMTNGVEEKMADDESPEKTAVSEEKTVLSEEDAAKQKEKEDAEMFILQETGFNIKIHAPGAEPFDLQVAPVELVQEIYQMLMDREDTCHRTCFSLQLDGQTLDNFTELKSIESLKEGSVIKVVEEPYTAREARHHVRHIRDLLKSVDNHDAYTGCDNASLSFLSCLASTVLENNIGKNLKDQQTDCTPPEYVMPDGKERPILPLHPQSKESTSPQCVKSLTPSAWNPPPGNRKLHGDLLYLEVLTMEDKRFYITACTKGFFVNQSSHDAFNPRQDPQYKYIAHSLVDLLNHLSPVFKRSFASIIKIRSQKHPYERVATPYQVHSWLSPSFPHTPDAIRAEDAHNSRMGYEEHIPGQTRDWNEELQTTRELPRDSLPERLIRERAIFKVHSDFVMAATRGAVAVVDGNIMPINPGEEGKMQMFLWNNIFFSLGFDVKDHYKDFGGDYAAYVGPGIDLQGVKAYSQVDTENVHTLGTVVVDYRGYRVTAQSIIPGILEREQEQSVVYGSIDFGKTVVPNEKYSELLQKTAGALKILPHKVLNEKDEEVQLLSSVECKGIIGNDKRHYVLDLLRTFPPDANFLPDEAGSFSEKTKAMGYPRQHRHKLVTLRQELVDLFVEAKYVNFLRSAAVQFQNHVKTQKAKEKSDQPSITDGAAASETDVEETKKLVESALSGEKTDESKAGDADDEKAATNREVVRAACQAVGSLSDTEFEMRFNTDVFQPHVRHANPEGEQLKKEVALVKEAAEFLLIHQIPAFVKECLEHSQSPADGFMLSDTLHHSGINIRYLGTITEIVSKIQSLAYLHSICVLELVCRGVKHVFKAYIQGVEAMSLSAAISHFLNCLLSPYPTPNNAQLQQEKQANKNKKQKSKKNSKSAFFVQDNTEWANETPKTLWKKIVGEVQDYYHYKLDCDSVETCVERYSLHKMALLRSFCKKLGVQLLLREFNLDSKTKQAFFEEDIVDMFPVVKNIHPKASDAYHVFTSGQNKIQQGLLREGYELISEALNLLNNVYGAMHPEIAACNRLLARLNYIMGDYTEALVYQQRAVMMSERVLGIDHPNTITEYSHFALYCFANHQIPIALRLMYRARYLALLCHGENHPEVALYDSNIGLILHAVMEFDLSLKFLQKALELNITFFGAKSLKVAMNYHLVARTFACKGDFRTALQNEKEAYAIYKSLLGENHEKTKDSSELLKKLTGEAVKFQKTMNLISKGERVQIPNLQVYTPTPQQVLETLNMINGIVFVHISQDDIEKFKAEMLRKHQAENGGGESTEKTDQSTPAIEEGAEQTDATNQKQEVPSEMAEPEPLD